MADAPESGGHGNSRKVALAAGLGLIAIGGYQLFKSRGPAGPAGPPGTPGASGSGFVSFDAWWVKVTSPPYPRPSVAGRTANQWIRDVIATYQKDTGINSAAGGVWGYSKFYAMYVQLCGSDPHSGDVVCGGGPSVLAPTGGGVAPIVKPPVISNPLALLPGMVIATTCQYGAANYVVDVKGAPLLGIPTNLVKRWIADQASWNALGVPRSCIRLVTAGVVQYLPNGAQLQVTLDITGGLPGVRRWAFGNPPSPLYSQSAGYCG